MIAGAIGLPMPTHHKLQRTPTRRPAHPGRINACKGGAPEHLTDYMDQAHILLADDDAQYAFILQLAFIKAGVANPPDVVTSHQQVIAYLSGVGQYTHLAGYPPPAAIILGLRRPLENDFQTLRWIRKHLEFSNVPVVVLSGVEYDNERRIARQHGANYYRVKPSNFDASVRIAERIRHRLLEPHCYQLAV